MTSTKSNQANNIVGGNQAGRDINITQAARERSTTMSNLIQHFRAEVSEDKTLREFIYSLQYYLQPVDEHQPKSLEEKLEAGERGEEVRQALALKELFAKKLHQYQLSPAAQEIFSYILGFLHHMFLAKVRPLMLSEARKEDIDAAVVNDVLQPALSELEGNILIINYQELRGMLYYLTGGCHLDWAK